MTTAFVVNTEATYDDLNNTIAAKLSQIHGIADAISPEEDDALWAVKDLTRECKEIAHAMFGRFKAAGGDPFHNAAKNKGGAE